MLATCDPFMSARKPRDFQTEGIKSPPSGSSIPHAHPLVSTYSPAQTVPVSYAVLLATRQAQHCLGLGLNQTPAGPGAEV